MKIVLDTNILVSGLLSSQGNPAQVLTLALAGAVQACYGERIVAEYAEVLARPRFKFDPKRVREVLNKSRRTAWLLMRTECPTWICRTRMMNRFWQSRSQLRQIF